MTFDHTDVTFLSIYRFPSLDAYKAMIKLAKLESERVFHLKMVNTSFKPNKLQLLGVLAHMQLSGAQGSLTRYESVVTVGDDMRSSQNSSAMK